LQGNEDLILVHDALEYGGCRLSIAVSMLPAYPTPERSILNPENSNY